MEMFYYHDNIYRTVGASCHKSNHEHILCFINISNIDQHNGIYTKIISARQYFI